MLEVLIQDPYINYPDYFWIDFKGLITNNTNQQHNEFLKHAGVVSLDEINYKYRQDKAGYWEYIIIASLIFSTTALLLVSYSLIWYRLRKSRAQFTQGSNSVASDRTFDKRERNLMKLAVGIVSTFMLCWLPFACYATLYVTETIESQLKPAIYELPFLLLAILNSLINPFLYFKIMTKMNFCRKCKRTSVQNNTTQQAELSVIKAPSEIIVTS